MPKIILHSPKYPGISLPVPQCPDTQQAGSYTFAVEHEYAVSAETATAIQRLLAGFPEPFRKEWSCTVVEDAPVAEPPQQEQEPPPPVELSEEDQALVAAEVAKLQGERLAIAIPRLQNTALNAELAQPLRLAYLQAVLASNLPKGIKAEASNLLKQLVE